jgi:hypothetical protein
LSASFIGSASLATATTFNIFNNSAIVGPGQSEAAGTISTNATMTFYLGIPAYQVGTSGFTRNFNAFVDLPIGFYGRLSNMAGNNSSMVEWRSCSISSIPSYLSVAYNNSGTSNDACLGVPITNNGEYDPSFVPFVDDNPTTGYSRVLYRSNQRLCWVDIRQRASLTTSSISKIYDNTYLINSISPVNAVDLIRRIMDVGINDYNGRATYRGAAFGGGNKVAAVIQSVLGNSFDVGDKLTSGTITAASLVTYSGPVSMQLPDFCLITPPNFGVNMYFNDTYVCTFGNLYNPSFGFFGSSISDLSGSLYVPTTVEPFAMGYPISNNMVQTGVESLFLGVGVSGIPDIVYDYAGYEIGNDLAGTWQSFFLYGNRYIYDGNQIWLATFNGSLYQSKSPVAVATGLTLVAISPEAAFFFSSFDNSLYVFDGGRTISKLKRMNDLRNSSGVVEAIQNGVFSERDNTLALQTASTFVWIRDSVVSQTTKKADQTSVNFYDTQNGLQIANNTYKWQYSYATLSGSTVFPFTWQSAYYGSKGNNLSTISQWVVTFYSPDGAISAPFTYNCISFDADQQYSQAVTLTINPGDWDSRGFYRSKIQPKNRKALAHSLKIDTAKHLVITDVACEYEDEAQAGIRASRSA